MFMNFWWISYLIIDFSNINFSLLLLPSLIYSTHRKYNPFRVKIIFYPRKIKVYSKNYFSFLSNIKSREREKSQSDGNETKLLWPHTLGKKAEILWTKHTAEWEWDRSFIHGSEAVNIVTTFRRGEKKIVRKPDNVFPLLLKTSLLRSTNASEWVSEWVKREKEKD